MSRSHHRPTPPLPDLEQGLALELTPAQQSELLFESAFLTRPEMREYSNCQTCGRATSFAETVARPMPAVAGIDTICTACVIACLIYRAALDEDQDPPQIQYGGALIL